MSEPYRAGPSCPHCGAAVAARDGRIGCDACGGALLAVDELAASIHELDGGDAPLELREPRPSAARCPRCDGAMQTCALALGTMPLGGGYTCCTRDGVWMSRDALAGAYALAAQRARDDHARSGRTYGAVMTSSLQGRGNRTAGPAPGTGMVAVAQGGQNPFAHGGELAISNWQSSRPRVHTLYVSAFRGGRLACSACGDQPLAFEGDRWVCPRCGGSFVEDAALVAMIGEMLNNAPWAMPAAAGAPGTRACPACKAVMVAQRFEGVAVERCDGHGVWFEHDGLATALHHAAEGEPPRPGWLHRLFHRGHTP